MKNTLMLFLLILSSSVMAEELAGDHYQFSSTAQTEQFNGLLAQLRCLVCQNQNLADSQAGLAEDLRREVYDLVQKNQSNKDIINFLAQRYGDFVLYKPPVKQTTWVLWFGPFLMLAFGLWFLLRRIRTTTL